MCDAAAKGDVQAIEALLDAGADVNGRSQLGWTPLIYAANGGHEAAIRSLLARGADHDARTDDGYSAADRIHRSSGALLALLATAVDLDDRLLHWSPELTGQRLSKAQADALRRFGVPLWWISALERHRLAGTMWHLPENLDESGEGVELQILDGTEILDECMNMHPGYVVYPLGLWPIAKCLVGTGDPYFIDCRGEGSSAASAPLVRVPHDVRESEIARRARVVTHNAAAFFYLARRD